MLLHPSMDVEPEAIPRPWLLPFMQQGAAVTLSWDRMMGFLGRLVRGWYSPLHVTLKLPNKVLLPLLFPGCLF